MSDTKYVEEETVIRKAMGILIKELGPMEAVRFVNLPRGKRLESVRRHREWQNLLNKDQFFAKIFGEEL